MAAQPGWSAPRQYSGHQQRYSVSQPYTAVQPGSQLPPLAPGAPDFPPPSSAASPVRQHHPRSGYPSQPFRASSQDTQRSQDGYQEYAQTGPPGGSSGYPARDWRKGHHSTHSQPVLPTYSGPPMPQTSYNPSDGLASPITSQADTLPARPVSPRPQLGGHVSPTDSTSSFHPSSPLHHGSHDTPLGHPQTKQANPPRIRSPQPRRNTLPATPDVMLAGPSHPELSAPSTSFQPAPASASKRPLPTPPGGMASPSSGSRPTMPFNSSSASSSRGPSYRPPSTASPILSRSPSAASSSSVSSSTGTLRRPLPKPPTLPPLSDSAPRKMYTGPGARSPAQPSSMTNEPESYARSGRPASYAQAQADAHGLGDKMREISLDSSPSEEASVPPTISIPSVAGPTSASADSPNLPTFSFDIAGEDEEESKSAGGSRSTGPSISISVAPPSPSLSKATSSDYFEDSLPDEHHPLPVSSVPMATSTAKSPSSSSSSSSYALACPGCGRAVLYGRTVNAMGKRWHPECFACTECDTKLEHLEFFTKDGKPYCHVDYHELFSIRCSHCNTPIVDESYITIDDEGLGGQKTFHELHFFCANCGDPFIDPKGRNTSSSNAEGDEYLAKPFTVHNGHAYCEGCNLKLHKTKCSSCKKPIKGDVLRALSKNWCEDCFVCDRCQKPFSEGTFLVYTGKPHCERCYKIEMRSAL